MYEDNVYLFLDMSDLRVQKMAIKICHISPYCGNLMRELNNNIRGYFTTRVSESACVRSPHKCIDSYRSNLGKTSILL